MAEIGRRGGKSSAERRRTTPTQRNDNNAPEATDQPASQETEPGSNAA
jgi:hypothetical protein